MDIYSGAMLDMKAANHVGNKMDLNIFVTRLNSNGVIGCALTYRASFVSN